MVNSILIRPTTPEDVAALVSLLAALGYPSTLDQIRARLALYGNPPESAVLVAESSSRILGMISFHRTPMMHADGFLGRITSLIVDAECRQQGLGRLLVEAVEKFAWAHDCTRLEVTSGDHRIDTHAFYEHLGYRCDCRRFIKSRTKD